MILLCSKHTLLSIFYF